MTRGKCVAHDSRTMETAYQVWAFLASRSPSRTLEILASDYGTDIPVRTLQRWIVDQGWADRVDRDVAGIAPAIRRETIAELILGAREAAQGLRRVVNGTEEPDKTRVTAYLGLLDRGGFGHIGNGAAAAAKPITAPIAELSGVNIDSLSVDELLQLEQRLRESDTVARS